MELRALDAVRAGRPGAVAALLALFVALHAPSLGWGFFADDWGHRLVLEHPEEQPTLRPWSLYDFGDVRTNGQAYFADGILAWWTDAGWKARFFRPLSSCVLWLEHVLFGRHAPAHHAMGLAWHALFLFLAWRLYRAAGLTGGVALLALAVLALEDGSVMSVGWVANRNSVIEGVCSAGALLCAFRARSSGRAAPLAGALALATLAALAKESGIAALLASALLLGTSAWPRARRCGAAAALLAVLVLAFLLLAGYGTRCQFYPTPWTEPARWLRHLVGMGSAGLAGTLGPYPVDALFLVPGAYWPLVGLAVLLLAPLARPWARALRSLELGPFLAAFALLSLVPQASAPPSDRLLYVPALGLAPITALMLARALGPGAAVGRWSRRLAWAVALAALPLSAAVLVARSALLSGVARDIERVFLEAELERAPPARRDVLVLQSPSVLAALSPLAAWRYLTGDRNTRFHTLQFGRRALRWTSLDERSFELESLDEPFLDMLFEGVFRSAPVEAGQVFRTAAFEVEVASGEPLRAVRVRCVEPLASDRFVLLVWSDGRWRRFRPPAPGETVGIEAGEPLRPMFP